MLELVGNPPIIIYDRLGVELVLQAFCLNGNNVILFILWVEIFMNFHSEDDFDAFMRNPQGL